MWLDLNKRSRRDLPIRFVVVAVLLGSCGILASRWVLNALKDQDFSLSSPNSVSTPSAVGSLLGPNPDAAVGDMIFLNDVAIQPGPRPAIFIVRGAQAHQLLVVSENAKPPTAAAPVVDIKGTLRRLPNRSTLKKAWKLNRDEIRVFGQQRVYLAADSIREEERGVDSQVNSTSVP